MHSAGDAMCVTTAKLLVGRIGEGGEYEVEHGLIREGDPRRQV